MIELFGKIIHFLEGIHLATWVSLGIIAKMFVKPVIEKILFFLIVHTNNMFLFWKFAKKKPTKKVREKIHNSLHGPSDEKSNHVYTKVRIQCYNYYLELIASDNDGNLQFALRRVNELPVIGRKDINPIIYIRLNTLQQIRYYWLSVKSFFKLYITKSILKASPINEIIIVPQKSLMFQFEKGLIISGNTTEKYDIIFNVQEHTIKIN